MASSGSAAMTLAPKRKPASSYCDHCGWGSKQGSIVKSWKRRYFVLKGLELIYFAERSPSGKGLGEKGRLKVAAVEFTPDFHNALLVRGQLKNQKMLMQLESNDECKDWYRKIKAILHEAAQEAEAARAKASAGSQGAIAMEGWLMKEGQNFKTWKRRYFTLRGKRIQYHAAQGEPPLGEVRVQSVNINASRKFALDIYSDQNRILRIAAESFATVEAWDRALARAIHRAPCFGDAVADKSAPFLGVNVALDMDCDGWLYMRGYRATSWKKRYFTLKHSVLQYSDNPGESSRGEGSVIDLRLGFSALQLEIKLDDGKWLTTATDTQSEYEKWLKALCELMDREPSSLDQAPPPVEPSGRFLMKAVSTLSFHTRGSEYMGARGSDVMRAGSESGSVRKAGWLRKEGQRMKSWRRRYFVLEGSRLQYYESVGMKVLKGEGDVARVQPSVKHANGLDVFFKSGRILRVTGDSASEIREWMESLQGGTAVDGGFRPSSENQSANSESTRASTISQFSDSTTSSGSIGDPMEIGRGWLLKQGKNFKSWKQRYIVLRGRVLTYARGVGEAPLGTGLVKRVAFGDARAFTLDVTLTTGRVLVLVAAVADEFITWCVAFKTAFERLEEQRHSMSANNLDEQGCEEHIGEEGIGADSDDDDDEDHDQGDKGQRVEHEDGGAVVDDEDDIAILASTNGLPFVLPLEDEDSEVDEVDGLHDIGEEDVLESSNDGEYDKRLAVTAHFNANMAMCSGWLRKEGGHVKSWKERFFTLYGSLLRYYKTEDGAILGSAFAVHVHIVHTRKHCFEITLESGRKLLVLAESQVDADRWISALRRGITVAREEKAAEEARMEAEKAAAAAALPPKPKFSRAAAMKRPSRGGSSVGFATADSNQESPKASRGSMSVFAV